MADAASIATDATSAAAENIAVCIRVRPLNERETRAGDAAALCCVPSLHVVSLTDPETGAPLSGKGNVFQYDEIFDASSDTAAMYARVGRRIVHSTLQGINGTIFAYGQTSSGKTYTMQGDGGAPVEPETSRSGLLQLAVDDIFQFIAACGDRDFLLRVSFVEIYNEVVKDLLTPTDRGANLKLREDPKKGVYVECQEKIITNYEDIVTLLQTGNRNRTVGHTAMNDKSSRSHSVFRIVIESKHKDVSRRLSEEDVDGAVLVASLNLVDLAGSESLRHTGAEGIRQREAGNINKSLLTLARVINALASSGGGGQNAPFRDSKLTRLLQNSLGGNTRTLIICCVTPSDRYIEETKSTLQFAARAKDIQTTATVNEVLDDQTQLRRLKREVHELRTLVNSEALTALKAENEALISEKHCNKSEMARLMGLILSSTSVAKANAASKERKQRGKRTRETWGPGDFPADIKALRSFLPHLYPHKRHSLAKENVDPQTPFHVNEDVNDISAAKGNFKLPLPAMSKLEPAWSELDDSAKNVLDLFSAVYWIHQDGSCKDAIAAVETIVHEKRALLDDAQRTRAFDVLANMVANVQSMHAMDGKQLLGQDVKARCLEVDHHSSESSLKVTTLVEEMKAKLEFTQESLVKEKKRCHDLEMEKASTQQMAEEELGALRCQLETLKLESRDLQHRLDREKHQLTATISTLGDEGSMSSRSSGNERDSGLKDAEASQTVLRLAAVECDVEIDYPTLRENEVESTEVASQVESIAEEEEELVLQEEDACALENGEQKAVSQNEMPSIKNDTVSRQDAPVTDQLESLVVEKLAGELQSIMQELAQLQSDHEQTALEKEELQAEAEKMSEEIEVAQRHVCEMSEALMEKEHIAKVLQAQMDAKLMTISQMQTKYSEEVGMLQQSIQDLVTEKDQLLAKTHGGSDAERGATTDDMDPQKPVIECSDSTEKRVCEEDDTIDLRSEVAQLAEQLVAVKSELSDTKERLQATLQTCDATLCHPKQETDPDSSVLADEQEQVADVGSLDQPDLRYNELKEDFARVSKALDNVSRERNDCVEELRALESQLMEVSEEKMKFAVAANEQENKLRKVQQDVLSSSATIATLRAQLEDAHSAKAELEASKSELEQSIGELQTSLTTLQVDYAALVKQMQDRETVATPGNESSTAEMEHVQQRLEIESRERTKLQLDVQSYEETLSVLREEAKNSSDTVADLLEKMRSLETDLDSAGRLQEKQDKEVASLTIALARSKEELDEMRIQGKQRLVAAEGKEMALQETILELEQQLKTLSGDAGVENALPQNDLREEKLNEARATQAELQSLVAALEDELAKAQRELLEQDSAWNKKQELAKKEFARLMLEQTQLRDEVLALQSSAEAAQEAHSNELLKAQESCTEVLAQKEAMQREFEAASTVWEEKQQDLVRQMDSFREQYQTAQTELDEYRKNADDEIHRLLSVVEQSDAELNELKHSYGAREEDYEKKISEQEDRIKSCGETLQAEYSELEAAHQQMKKENAMLEDQRRRIEEQLQNEIDELQQTCAAVQTQQAKYQAKLKEMEAQLELTENEVTKKCGELKSLANSLKAAEKEAVNNHNKLVEAQLANESMEKLVDKQKARIDKLDRVKMTTETLEMFRKLKKDRLDLQVKVQSLQKHLAEAEQAPAQSRDDRTDKRSVAYKNEELSQLKEQVEELREAVRDEKHKALHDKAKMRAALNDEREKAEHEIQEMQALVKEKMELVETLESQLASVEDAMAKLCKKKSESVSYLENEPLRHHSTTSREQKKQMEYTSSLSEKDEVTGGTGMYDIPATAAAKVVDGDISTTRKASEVNVGTDDVNLDDCDATTEASPHLQGTSSGAAKAGGFVLPAQTDAIATNSQEEPNGGEHPECAQQ
ncbi:unnamed protein product [Hyaloperonospora brassicae]|uniref:Kinesin motor domain-containing protein n=1 Tax=Hyaloperonospora brassicae TaxID=162125 RepID=A0AAV0UEI2_HYABA|nr:unnamed protein product [Hyaloperonospora brassicae]